MPIINLHLLVADAFAFVPNHLRVSHPAPRFSALNRQELPIVLIGFWPSNEAEHAGCAEVTKGGVRFLPAPVAVCLICIDRLSKAVVETQPGISAVVDR